MRLCPSQLQLSLNPPDVFSVEAGGVTGWLLWEVTRSWLKRWWMVRSRSGGGWVVIWGEKCLCPWDAGALKIAHVPRTDLVTPLLFLMIKVEPEGRCSGGRQWYGHISLTLIFTGVSKHCSLKCKISKHQFKVFFRWSLLAHLLVSASKQVRPWLILEGFVL